MSSGAPDWDASTYHRISEIQAGWARDVVDRLALGGDETVLDAGCGSGRVTRMLLERLPEGHVIGVDASAKMIAEARQVLGGRVTLIESDLTEIDLDTEVDAVFSNAVFHWVLDHDRLFGRLAANMRPGAHLVAQCGGEGNVKEFIARAEPVVRSPRFAPHFEDWREPWYFSSPNAAAEALRRAGFTDVDCGLQPASATPEDPREFLRVVCLNPYLPHLPEELREPFVDAVQEVLPEPLTLDYVRLNISARKP